MIPVDSLDNLHGHVVQLVERYGWTLLREDALTQAVRPLIQPGQSTVATEHQIIRHYATVLYAACCQEDDGAQRALAYCELHRFLHYNAQKEEPTHADDLAQAALQLVYAQLARCRQPESFFSFALFKLRHVTKEFRRRQAKEEDGPAIDDDLAQRPTGEPSGLLTQLCRQEGWELLWEAVKQLADARQVATIRLKFIEGLADEEIAEQLGITANHVRVLRNRALAKLRTNAALLAYFGHLPST